jgi:oligo-1,6-glucosidase
LALVYGDYNDLAPDHPRLFAYERAIGADCFRMYLNMSSEPLDVALPDTGLILSNDSQPALALGGWEARIYRL